MVDAWGTIHKNFGKREIRFLLRCCNVMRMHDLNLGYRNQNSQLQICYACTFGLVIACIYLDPSEAMAQHGQLFLEIRVA